MESKNCLGIHISENKATAVLLAAKSSGFVPVDCFSVNIQSQDEEEDSGRPLAELLAKACNEKDLVFSETAVAIDCAQFTQHNIHTAFTDPKQIGQTIRFDAEEALATDTTELAIAFNIIKTDATGSNVTVFSAEKTILSDLITDLQTNNMDPVTVEPDVICLARYLQSNINLAKDSKPLFAVLSERVCYLVKFSQEENKTNVRTFHVSSSQNMTDLLARQILLSIAADGDTEFTDILMLSDAANKVDCGLLEEKLSIGVQPFDLAESVITPDFAIAYGVAIGQLTKTNYVDFRRDFLPYQGRKLIMQKTIKALSISATVLIIAVGLYFQLQVFKTNRYLSQLNKKINQQYAAAMFNKKIPPEGVVSRLGREITKIQKIKSGLLSAAGEESISAKLTFVLEAFNNAPANIDLNINTITITTKTITIAGDTNRRKNTLRLFDSIKKHQKLKISQSTYELKAGRDKFRITVLLN